MNKTQLEDFDNNVKDYIDYLWNLMSIHSFCNIFVDISKKEFDLILKYVSESGIRHTTNNSDTMLHAIIVDKKYNRISFHHIIRK